MVVVVVVLEVESLYPAQQVAIAQSVHSLELPCAHAAASHLSWSTAGEVLGVPLGLAKSGLIGPR